MRYYIIFGITFILLLIILFYNPFLGVYKNNVTIEYNFKDEGYSWNYKVDGDSLVIDQEEDNKWTFNIKKNGVTKITFNYSNGEKNKYEIYYKFRVIGKHILWTDGYGNGLLNYPNPY